MRKTEEIPTKLELPVEKRLVMRVPKKEEPKAKPEEQKKEAPPAGEEDVELSTLTVVFGRFNPPTVGHENFSKRSRESICWW